MMMTEDDQRSTGPGDQEFPRNSVLYREFLAEREEILRHKWLESEKAGHDIGFEKALLGWILTHRSGWRSRRNQELREGRAGCPRCGGIDPGAS